MAKLPDNMWGWQEHRNNIARDIQELTKYGETWRNLAQVLINDEQKIMRCIESFDKWWVENNPERSEEIAEMLIMAGRWRYVAKNLEKFWWLNHQKIAEKLIVVGRWCDVANYLENFKWLDYKKIAEEVIENWWWRYVAKNLKKFGWLDHKEIAKKLIEVKWWEDVVDYLENFEWLKEIIEMLIEAGKWRYLLEEKINIIKWLDYKNEIAEKFIKEWEWRRLIPYLKVFDSLSHKELIKKMVMSRGYDERVAVWKNLDKFQWLDEEVANIILGSKDCYGAIRALIDNLEKFEWLNHNEIAKKAIKAGESRYVAHNLEKFEWLNYKEIAETLFEVWKWYYVGECLDKFKWVDHKEIAEKLIKIGKWESVGYYLENFEWLDTGIAKKLIEAWYWDVVLQNPEKFWLKKEK